MPVELRGRAGSARPATRVFEPNSLDSACALIGEKLLRVVLAVDVRRPAGHDISLTFASGRATCRQSNAATLQTAAFMCCHVVFVCALICSWCAALESLMRLIVREVRIARTLWN